MARVVPVLFVLACGTPAAAGDSVDVQVLHTVREKPGTLLVDVRTPGEFASGHAPGAVNIPLDTLGSTVPEAIAKHEGPVYLICQSGRRSASAQATLEKLGVETIDVQGGTAAWKSAGFPVE